VKVQTSITLPPDLLHQIGRVDKNRSAFLKTARETRDAEILNSRAERLNEEALDVLEYQGLP